MVGSCASIDREASQSRPEPIYVNTRVVLSVQDTFTSGSFEQAKIHLAYAEEVFKDLNIHFVVTKEDIIGEDRWGKLFADGHQNQQYLNIYFTSSTVVIDRAELAGGSYLPDDRVAPGTVIVNYLAPYTTVAHEIGHTLGGLKHTFEDDGCTDTYTPAEYAVANYGSYLEYNNLMNYHVMKGHDFITGQQRDKMLENIRLFGGKKILKHYPRQTSGYNTER
jgi:hypothetical protein